MFRPTLFIQGYKRTNICYTNKRYLSIGSQFSRDDADVRDFIQPKAESLYLFRRLLVKKKKKKVSSFAV